MTAPFADASVDVVANFDHFDPQFTRKLKTSVTESAVATEAPLKRMTGNVNRAAFALAKLAAGFVLVVGKAIIAAAAAGVFGLAAAALTVQTFALAGALLPVGGLIAGLPAVLGVAGAAVATFKLALQGMDEVVKALGKGDLDAFNKALKNVSPNGRAVATELRGLLPHFTSLRFAVQDSAFAGLDRTLHNLANNLFPTVRRGLTGIASAFNTSAKSVAGFFSTRTARSDLAQVLETARVAAGNLGRAIAPLAKALLGTMVAAGPAVALVTRLIGDAAGRFAVWTARARESGLLTRILLEAMHAAHTLGGVISDVGGIIKAVFTAGAGAAGGNMLTNLRALTSEVRAFLSSAAGQNTLTALFTAITTEGAPMLALFRQVAGIVVGTLIPMITQLATGAGPGLMDLITGLGQGLAALLPAAGPVGGALSAIGTALGPLVAQAGGALATTLVPLAENLAKILPVIVPAMLQMLTATGDTNTVVAAVTPNTQLFGDALQWVADHLDTVRQYMPAIIGAFIAYKASQAAANTASLLTIPIQIAQTITARAHTRAMRANTAAMNEQTGAENLGIFARLRGKAAEIGSTVATYARTAATWLWLTAQRAATIAAETWAVLTSGQNIKDAASAVILGVKTGALWLWTAAQSAASIAAGVWTAAQWALNIAMDANPIGLVVLAIAALVGIIYLAYTHSATFRNILAATGEAFVTLWHWIVEGAQFIWHWVQIAFTFTPLGAFIAGIRLVIAHWGQIRAAIGAGVEAIVGFFARMGARVLDFVVFFALLPVRIATALGGLAAALGGKIGEAWDWAVSTTRDRILGMIGLVLGIRQRILDALTGARNWLAGIGKNIIDGLVGGVKDKLTDAKKAFTGLADSVPAWMKNALGIHSPSTVMYQIGTDTVDGFANGITAGQAKVRAAALRIKVAAEEAMGTGPFSAHQPNDPHPYGVNNTPSLSHQPNDPFPYGRVAAERVKSQLQKDKELLAELDKIAAGHGKKLAVQPVADAGTGLGGSAGGDLVSKAQARAKARADKLAKAAAAALAKHRQAMENAGKFLSDGFLAGLTGSTSQIKSAADKMAGLLTAALGHGKASPLVATLQADSLRLRALATERDSTAKQLTAAQKNLDALITSSNQLRDQIAGKVRSSFALVPQAGTLSVETLLATMGRAVKQAAAFAADVARLSARGLAKPLLAQLAEAGPVAGAAMAARLAAASGTQLAELNKMSGRLEAAATSTGNTVADAMYKSGIQAAQGLVDGLKAKHKDIEDTMLSIAHSIQAAIRKALGIKSPSEVMRGLGTQIGAGLALGILASAPPVKAAMGVLAGHTLALPTAAPHIPAQRGAAPPAPAGGAAGHRGAPLIGTMNVNLPTGDGEAAAQTVVNRIAATVGP